MSEGDPMKPVETPNADKFFACLRLVFKRTEAQEVTRRLRALAESVEASRYLGNILGANPDGWMEAHFDITGLDMMVEPQSNDEWNRVPLKRPEERN